MNMKNSVIPEPVYLGWRVLAGSFISAALAIGFTIYIAGMFTVPVSEEFGISRSGYNNGVVSLMLGIAVASPIVGKLLDRFSARSIMSLAGLGFGLALMAISRIDELWAMVVLLAGPVAFGAAACGVLGANTVVVRWFRRRRGRAMGMLALSTSVGGFVSQPLTGWLISSFGWRDALFMIGLAVLLIFLLLNALLIRNRPSEDLPGYSDEFSDDGSSAAADSARLDAREWTNGQLLRSRNFWLLTAGIGLFFGVDQAVLVSQVPYFQDAGYDMQTASILVAVKTISAIGGKLVVGYLADKVDLRLLFVCVASCNVLLMVLYILQPHFWVLLACLTVLGIAVGGVFPVWTTLTAWLFGTRSYGAVMGLMQIVIQPCAVLGVRFIGDIYDYTGSYIPAFALFIVLVITAIVLVTMVKPPEDKEKVAEADGGAA